MDWSGVEWCGLEWNGMCMFMWICIDGKGYVTAGALD